ISRDWMNEQNARSADRRVGAFVRLHDSSLFLHVRLTRTWLSALLFDLGNTPSSCTRPRLRVAGRNIKILQGREPTPHGMRH
ncbi:MAG: hypothetical protein WBW41_11980, partial [Verrucomicrobiia bacterium]